MHIALFILGILVIAVVLLDAFETVVLPRRVTRRFRLARLFYRNSWKLWQLVAMATRGRRREMLFSFFGPLSLLALFALWAAGLIVGFALVQWGSGTTLNITPAGARFSDYLYLSGTTFFTLGFGDVVPVNSLGRTLAVLESGTGFGLLALVLGYLPVMYQAFSRREVTISMLDARAGTPPTAAELVRRHKDGEGKEALRQLLHDWERWAAELMESHLSYPVLAYFRSQHDNQSWLAALTAVLDTCALLMSSESGALERQARLTFAMARHAVVDLSQVFGTPPEASCGRRLSAEDWKVLMTLMGWTAEQKTMPAVDAEGPYRYCALYDPYVTALADHLRITLPRWVPPGSYRDNWQISGWERHEGEITPEPAAPIFPKRHE